MVDLRDLRAPWTGLTKARRAGAGGGDRAGRGAVADGGGRGRGGGGGIGGRKTARRGGWSGGMVRLVDALAPALRCSRDI
jgi:hypothetical protein